jgi:hypothetical protein
MLGELVAVVKMPRSRVKTERPREPLLQPDIEACHVVRSIGGRRRSRAFGPGGAISEIPLSA